MNDCHASSADAPYGHHYVGIAGGRESWSVGIAIEAGRYQQRKLIKYFKW